MFWIRLCFFACIFLLRNIHENPNKSSQMDATIAKATQFILSSYHL